MRTVSLFIVAMLAPAASAQQRTQVHLKEPAGMKVYWLTTKDGKTSFSTTPLEAPGRFNFAQGAAYRLKLTHLPGHPGLELFPTLEVASATPHARDFLAHNAAPITLSEEDVNLVVKGNYLVKVVYLPFQEGADNVALASGQDAVREAARRGSILLVLRIGNIDRPPEPKR